MAILHVKLLEKRMLKLYKSRLYKSLNAGHLAAVIAIKKVIIASNVQIKSTPSLFLYISSI